MMTWGSVNSSKEPNVHRRLPAPEARTYMGVATQRVPTSGFRMVARVVKKTLLNQGICLIWAEPGLGKTFSIEHTLLRLRDSVDPETLFCQLQFPSSPSMLRIAQELYKSVVGAETKLRREADISDRLYELLRRPTVIFIDEAQHLTDDGMHYLRLLWEDRDTNLTIVFAGIPEAFNQIARDEALFRRLYGHVRLDRLNDKQIIDLMPSFHPLLRNAPSDSLLKIDDEYAFGSFGHWAGFMKWAEDVASEDGLATINDELIDKVLAVMPSVGPPLGWAARKAKERAGKVQEA